MQKTSLCPIGGGIILPNVKVKALKAPYALFYVLDKALEFDAPDGKPMDIICMVLSPTDLGTVHLQRLSRFSRLLKDKSLCAKIRDTHDEDVIRALLSSPDGLMIAA